LLKVVVQSKKCVALQVNWIFTMRIGLRYILLGLWLCNSTAMAQTRLVDSLKAMLPKLQNTSQRIDLLNDLAWELKEDNPDAARKYLDEAALLAAQQQYIKGEAQAYNNRGVLENIHANLNEAIVYFQKALPLREKIKDEKGVAALHNNIGNVYEDQNKYLEAMDEYRKSLSIVNVLKDEKRIARVHYNIANLHERMGNYYEAQEELLRYLQIVERQEDKEGLAKAYTILGHLKSELEFFPEAEDYYQKALTIRLALNDDKDIADAFLNLGNGKSDNKKYTEALQLYENALQRYEKGDYVEAKASALNNIGVAYKDLNELELALKHFEQALALRQTMKDKRGIMETYNGIGDVERRQANATAALDYALRYLRIAEEIKDEKYIQKAYKDLALAYEMLGNYKAALTYRVKYDELRYARLSESRIKDIQRREVAYGDYQKQLEIEKKQRQIQEATALRNMLIGAVLAFVLISILLYNRYKIKNNTATALAERNSVIEQERKRSDELLLNILPETTAQELKEKGYAEAKFHESVTVLFTDFKAFTRIAEQLSAEEIVQELDICFKAFDVIVEKYQIEKIKTIGDAYMCVAGLPLSQTDHAHRAVKAALEMQRFIADYNEKRLLQQQEPWEMRIGLHSGSVVAGVVGNKKFAYDIWGDTVNIAARMESAGAIGKVNISQTVFDFIKNAFICEPRGKIAAKNKDEIEMYFVQEQSVVYEL
jgi:adenylate cyclase